jgi:hypothetical protein
LVVDFGLIIRIINNVLITIEMSTLQAPAGIFYPAVRRPMLIITSANNPLVGLDWIGLGWVGLGWIGLDWVGLGWLGWIGLA